MSNAVLTAWCTGRSRPQREGTRCRATAQVRADDGRRAAVGGANATMAVSIKFEAEEKLNEPSRGGQTFFHWCPTAFSGCLFTGCSCALCFHFVSK